MASIRASFGLIVVLPAMLAASAAAPTVVEDDRAIVHVLNRIGFGPAPGDVERVRAMGLRIYIERQLHPEQIVDAALSARLQHLTTLHLSSARIAEQYERPMLEARREQRQIAGNEGSQAAPRLCGRRRPWGSIWRKRRR